MKSISIQGFPTHTYKEGSGYLVNYTFKTNNVTKKSRHYFKKKTNKCWTKLRFDYLEDHTLNYLDQKLDQALREDNNYKIEPFVEKEVNYKNIEKNKTFYKKRLGYFDSNEVFLELDEHGYQDKEKLNLKEFVFLSESDVNNYIYPITFNSSSFHRRGAKIDVFSQINKITVSNIGVDQLKGFKGFAFNNGQNAESENIKIKSYKKTNDICQIHFEDGIIQDILYNKNTSKVIDKIDVIYNPSTGEFTNSYSYKEVLKISNEPRYLKKIQKDFIPYKDYDNNKNNPYIKNNENFFYNKLTDETLNNKLINNSIYINKENEGHLYTCAGKSIDYSVSSGKESLLYYESLD